jgi:hypothetical protein
MSLRARIVLSVVAGVAAVCAPDARASRPMVGTGVVRIAHVATGDLRAGRPVSGGGRGQTARATHRDERPPATHAATAEHDGCVVAGADQARRRPTESRTLATRLLVAGLRAESVVGVAHDARSVVPAAVFHDAHAPPAASRRDVAGPLV